MGAHDELPEYLFVQIIAQMIPYEAPQPAPSEDNGPDAKFVGPDSLSLMDTSWLTIMLVCRRWREIVVETSTLWRYIDIGRNPDWTKLALARSSSCIIDVSMITDCPHPNALEMLIPHARRIRRLRIGHLDEEQLPVIAKLLGMELPALQDLSFIPDPDSWDLFSALQSTGDSVAFTAQSLPRLRSFRLHILAVPTDPLLYRSLRTLSLNLCTFAGLSLDTFLNLLARSPDLEEIYLTRCLGPDRLSTFPTPTIDPVFLPKLSKIVLGQHTDMDTACFLARMQLPPDVHLSLDVFRPRDSEPLRILSILPPDYSTTLPILQHISEATMRSLHGKNIFEGVAGDHARSLGSLSICLRDSRRTSDEGLSSGLSDLPRVFRCAPLTRLTLKCDREPDKARASYTELEYLFRTFPNLEYISASGFDMEMSVLARFDDAAGLMCTRLKHLKINDCSTLGGYSPAMDRLVECVRIRADRGCRLQRLDLSVKCAFLNHVALGEQNRQRLEPFVDAVTLKSTFVFDW